jgi:ABC-type branched-subunit amino acid transport system substrate-binding protein
MARNVRRRRVLQGVGAAGVIGLAGCTTSDDGGSPTGTDSGGGLESRSSAIKLGVLMPETGDLSSLGIPIRDAALLPATQVTDSDVAIDVDTQVEDTQTNPTAGVSAAEALVNAGYPMVTGPAGSGVNLQVTREVLIPGQVVGNSPSSTSPAVTDLADNDYIFRTAPSDALQGEVIAQVSTDRENASTAATMYVNNSYGQSLSESFANAFSGTVQNQVSFEKEQPSYTSRLNQALSGDPDILVVIGYPASGVQLFRDYYADFSGDRTIMVTDGLKDKALPSDVGNDLANVVGTAPLPSGPQADAFSSAYEEAYGQAPGVFNAHAYDASASMILANVAAGENDGTAVRDNLRTVSNPDGETVGPSNMPEAVEMVANGTAVNYAGASSSVNYDDNGDMAAVSYEVFEFAPASESGFNQISTVDFSA